MTPRVLFVGQTGALGGAELMLFDVVRHFRGSCGVALLSDGPLRHRLEEAGVPVELLAVGDGMLRVSRQAGSLAALAAGPALAVAIWRLAKRARRYDILYPNSQKAAVVALVAGRLIGKPVVWHLHDILSPDHFGGIQRRAIVSLANIGARRIIANSGASRDAFIAAGGNSRRVSVVPNGIDARPFDAVSDPGTATIRRELGVGDAPLVGLFGRLSPWKGQHVLIEAMPRLPGLHIMIVGEALFGEFAYRDALMRRAEVLGVAGRVHWLGFRDDIPGLMRATDLIVHTSVAAEPFGRVIVEAMLARRPVITARKGAGVELLGENYPFFVPSGDPDALAAAILQTLGEPARERDQWVAANYRRARDLFSTERMLAGIEQALEIAA